jgi:phosphatidylglycerol:prolipoprotein diacylglycerol transferase
MLVHPQFDPVAIQLGPVAIHWYGLMYLIAFVQIVLLGRWAMKHRPWTGWDAKMIDDVLFYGVIGVIVGGRLGYVLFYKPAEYLANPVDIFKVWEGGMSFHGGFLGVIVALALFSRVHRLRWLAVTDFIAPLVPLGLAAGRLGNFINGELWGRATDLPWGMVFPQAHDGGVIRHPSQLYQLAGEGLLLFVILWLYSRKPRPVGAISGVFLVGYGSLRFLAEFAREPDDFLGLLGLGLSMGQWLSLPMVAAGVGVLVWAQRKPVASRA